MGEVAEPVFHGFLSILHESAPNPMYGREKVMGDGNDDDLCDSASSSIGTNESDASSSTDSAEVTSSTSPPQMDSSGPLYELSSLMATLPIKRGLSKYFLGKSQSFTSLSKVTSIEDLAKKEIPYKKKMKTCKSVARGLDCHRSSTLGTKCTITKKPPRASCSSLPGKRIGAFLGGVRHPSPYKRTCENLHPKF